jgi:serine/threonine protein kinase
LRIDVAFPHILLVHHQGIIHRDIKPANLLWSKDHDYVKISDFGVSHYSSVLRLESTGDETDPASASIDYAALDEEALAKTAGSPAFFAPELCHNGDFTPLASSSPSLSPNYFADNSSFFPSPNDPDLTPIHPIFPPSRPSYRSTRTVQPRSHHPRPKITKAIDVWALGVTLYCLLFARVPFEAPSEFMLFGVIPTEDFDVPELMGSDGLRTGGRKPGKNESWEARELGDLLNRMLTKDPEKRITLNEVKVGRSRTRSSLYSIKP